LKSRWKLSFFGGNIVVETISGETFIFWWKRFPPGGNYYSVETILVVEVAKMNNRQLQYAKGSQKTLLILIAI
jgi:hypothetical protein